MSAPAAAARIRGVDEPLPAGERLIWQGAPDRRSLARRRLHGRTVAGYFALLLAWRAVAAAGEPAPLTYLAVGAAGLAALAALGVGAVHLFAWLVARSSTYAITDRRVVMRIGVALPSVLNIPLRLVTSAAVRPHAEGTATIVLQLEEESRFAWILLWPHARPWHLSVPKPSLLCVPDGAAVGEALRDALLADAAARADAAPAAAPHPAPDAEPARTLIPVPR